MTRVLVTGAAGFLGSPLVEKLCELGYQVRVVLHDSRRSISYSREVETVTGDIRDPKRVQDISAGCGAIVHLAAKVHAIDDCGLEQDYQAVNVEGTRNVLDAAVASGVKRVVFASSVKVFGEETSGCIDESWRPEPKTDYGRSKWLAEQLISDYTTRHDITAVSLRLPMVYGPTKKGNLYRMIEAIDQGRFPVLPRLPTVRSLLHVQNFVQAVVLCLQAPHFKQGAYIVTDAQPYNVADLYDWLRAGLGRSPARWRVPLWMLKGGARAGDLLQLVNGRQIPLSSELLTKLIGGAWFSAEAITRELGYQPAHSFAETVPELIAFYRKAARIRSATNSYGESHLVR
ncbi:MAG: NAD-dependent epimerase/dehydratase family protein [Nitrospira sp.]|nr:NAD-dependent epimerase/dehydratase family protein [Nitrospira sp.]